MWIAHGRHHHLLAVSAGQNDFDFRPGIDSFNDDLIERRAGDSHIQQHDINLTDLLTKKIDRPGPVGGFEHLETSLAKRFCNSLA